MLRFSLGLGNGVGFMGYLSWAVKKVDKLKPAKDPFG